LKPEFAFKKVAAAAKDRIESEHHIAVVWRDLPEGVTGDLDGEEIVLDVKNDPETELYVLLHLFGHTCQWNTNPHLRKLGYEKPFHASPEKLKEIHDYERCASRIGLTLLEEIGHGELREWLSRFFAADWKFLEVLYATGEHTPMQVQWNCPCELLDPLAIPRFAPHEYQHRQAFE